MKKTRILGNTDIEISTIGYGCMGQTHWGYPADSTEVLQFDGKDWLVSSYYKDGFTAPFG